MGCKEQETVRVWDDSENCIIRDVRSRVGRTHYAHLCGEVWSCVVRGSGRCVQRVKPQTVSVHAYLLFYSPCDPPGPKYLHTTQ